MVSLGLNMVPRGPKIEPSGPKITPSGPKVVPTCFKHCSTNFPKINSQLSHLVPPAWVSKTPGGMDAPAHAPAQTSGPRGLGIHPELLYLCTPTGRGTRQTPPTSMLLRPIFSCSIYTPSPVYHSVTLPFSAARQTTQAPGVHGSTTRR